MNYEQIGVATALSKEKHYDPMDTLLFCKQHDIALVQIYMDMTLVKSSDYIIEIREFAKECGIALTCHAPEPLNDRMLSEIILTAAEQLLFYQPEKKLIVHYDETQPLKKTISSVEALNKRGFAVCLENFYFARDEQTFLGNIDTFNSVFSLAEKYGFSIYPVMDFPRLFIAHIFNNYNSLVLTEQIIDTIASHPFKVILHLIDFNDYSQNRESWCALGKGLMPYNAIFQHAESRGILYDHGILEYEDKKLTLESLEAMREIG